MSDPFDLQRFLDAQAGVYAQVLEELEDGRKTSHWMWFVFPQLRGLGHSPMAHRYGIASLDEARAYLEHPVLGARLRECTRLALRFGDHPIAELLGPPDDQKFRSCMTLFQCADPDEALFAQALRSFFNGTRDARTLEMLRDAGCAGGR